MKLAVSHQWKVFHVIRVMGSAKGGLNSKVLVFCAHFKGEVGCFFGSETLSQMGTDTEDREAHTYLQKPHSFSSSNVLLVGFSGLAKQHLPSLIWSQLRSFRSIFLSLWSEDVGLGLIQDVVEGQGTGLELEQRHWALGSEPESIVYIWIYWPNYPNHVSVFTMSWCVSVELKTVSIQSFELWLQLFKLLFFFVFTTIY